MRYKLNNYKSAHNVVLTILVSKIVAANANMKSI